jgi:hypothetical protein
MSVSLLCRYKEGANGSRYRRLGGLRERHFDGTDLKLRKRLENAQTPRRRVHALLAAFFEQALLLLKIFI